MTTITGTLNLVTTAPSRVDKAWVRAPRVRSQGDMVVTVDSTPVTVDTGRVEFTALPGPCVLMLDAGGALTAVRLFIPDTPQASLAECVRLADSAARDLDELQRLMTTLNAGIRAVDDARRFMPVIDRAQTLAEKLSQQQGMWQGAVEILQRWQPQYEWLKTHAADGFMQVKKASADAAAGVKKELAGILEQTTRARDDTAKNATAARASAAKADQAAQARVTAAIDALKGGVSAEYDTLQEIVAELKNNSSLAATLVKQVADKAPKTTVDELTRRLDGLTIDRVKGLKAALAGKASTTHTHHITDITGLDVKLAGKADAAPINSRLSQLEKQAATKPDAVQLKIVDTLPPTREPNIVYVVVKP